MSNDAAKSRANQPPPSGQVFGHSIAVCPTLARGVSLTWLAHSMLGLDRPRLIHMCRRRAGAAHVHGRPPTPTKEEEQHQLPPVTISKVPRGTQQQELQEIKPFTHNEQGLVVSRHGAVIDPATLRWSCAHGCEEPREGTLECIHLFKSVVRSGRLGPTHEFSTSD